MSSLSAKTALFTAVLSVTHHPGLPEAKKFPRTWDFSAKTRTVPGIPWQLVTLTVSPIQKQWPVCSRCSINNNYDLTLSYIFGLLSVILPRFPFISIFSAILSTSMPFSLLISSEEPFYHFSALNKKLRCPQSSKLHHGHNFPCSIPM